MSFKWNDEAAEQAKQSNAAFEALPIGIYRVIINKVEDKETKSGGAMLVFEFEVIEGSFKGRRLWSNMNYRNANPKAEDIGWREIVSISSLIFGEGKRPEFTEFEGKTVRIETKHETYNGVTQARVKRFLADGSAPTTKPTEDTPF